MPSSSDLQNFQQQSRERLYPSLTNANWLVLRQRRRIFEAGLGKLPTTELSVLDIGGRLQPYRPLLSSRIKNYLAVDLCLTPLVNVSAAAEALPFGDGQFDLVICTQVFEYLPDPAAVVAEIRRVLRSGGMLFVSSPSVLLRTNEAEYWRFLPQAWKYLLRDFLDVQITPEGNSLIGFFRTNNVFLLAFFRPRFLVPLWKWTMVPLLNVAGWILEGLGGQNADFAANYSVWARK
jgi:SAM-dependent methyltransferase